MRLGDALDRLDQRVFTRYPWLEGKPKRPSLFRVLLFPAVWVALPLAQLAFGASWADVVPLLVLYAGIMVLFAPVLVLVYRRARRAYDQSDEAGS